MATTVRLRSGTLRVVVEQSQYPLETLCGFGSRRSRKRGFVFVSKVLGKHYPVRPRLMAEVHARLAESLRNLPGPVVFVALAETATGLGQGIFEEWLRATGRDDGLFLHTTRYRLRRPLAFGFEESHSHAPDHLLYEPDPPSFRRAATLVLIDDELSTGRTLVNLAAGYRRVNPSVTRVEFVCLTDFLGRDRRRQLSGELGRPVTVHSLLSGAFEFDPDPSFDPGELPNAVGRGDAKDELLRVNHGRLGVAGPMRYDWDALIDAAGAQPGEQLLVLGSGEFAHAPFLLARRLEERGADVRFQSTTRSPLLIDADLTSRLEFLDNYGDGIANYVYNVADRRYDRIVIGYETRPLPPGHAVPGAVPVYC